MDHHKPLVAMLFSLVVFLLGCGKPKTEVGLDCGLSGTINIDPNLARHLTGDERLFVVARSLDGESVAVQLVTGLDLPLNFCITSANVLDATGQLPTQLRLSALLTLSSNPFGNGMTGSLPQPVSLGSQGIRIWITSAEDAVLNAPRVGTSQSTAMPAGFDKEGLSRSIDGTVTLGVPLDDGGRPSDMLYIIARSLDGRSLAVSAPHRQPRFPLKYQLDRDTIMMGRIPDDQDIVVLARLDRDGNAFSSTGDLEGECERKPVRIGDINVNIVLDTFVR